MKKRSRKKIFTAALALALLVSLIPAVGLRTMADDVYEGADDTDVVYDVDKDTTPVKPEDEQIIMEEVVYEAATVPPSECTGHTDVKGFELTDPTGAQIWTETNRPDGLCDTCGTCMGTHPSTHWKEVTAAKLNSGELDLKYGYRGILPTGHYYLSEDIDLTTCTDGGLLNLDYQTINLCLCGHDITSSTSVNNVVSVDYYNTVFNLYDCTGGGSVAPAPGLSCYYGVVNVERVAGNEGGPVFNLYGGTITGNETEASGQAIGESGVYVASSGTFNMYGGSVADNHAVAGGGVYVGNGGTFNMSGGSITGNSAANTSSSQGGGVYVRSGGTFNMSGGSISGNSVLAGENGGELFNSSNQGGGVYVSGGTFNMSGGSITGNIANQSNASARGGGVSVGNGTFNMSGGSITGNRVIPDASGNAVQGGGVYFSYGTFNMSGSPIVSGNTVDDSVENVCLASYSISIAGAFEETANVGITKSPTGYFSNNAWKTYHPTDIESEEIEKFFTSDDPAYGFGVDTSGRLHINTLYDVTFKNGDEDFKTTKIARSCIVKEPTTDPTKTGYTFNEWRTSSSGTTAWDFASKTVSSATSIYAAFTPNTYTVKFDGNTSDGGSAPADMAFTYDEEQTLNANTFTKTGHSFGGWATTEGGAKAYDDGQTGVKNLTAINGGTVTLYAVWNPHTYTVVFNSNGGTGSMDDQNFTYDVAQTLTANGFSKAGYEFKGWSITEGGEKVYDNTQSVSNLTDTDGGTVNLYAVWGVKSYEVAFNANGGSGSMTNQSFTYDVAQTLTENGFSKTGYHFIGWDTSSAAANVVYTDEQSVSKLAESGTFNLYAVWEANPYKVTFNNNGGTGSMADQNFTYDVPQNLSAGGFSKTGYTLTGWNTVANGSGTPYGLAASVSNLTAIENGTVELFAQWSADTHYVIFNGNESTNGEMNPMGVTYDEAAKPLTENAFTKTGYHFLEWNTAPDGSGDPYAEDATVSNLTADLTLYAQWEINQCTISFDSAGGSAVTSISGPYNSDYIAPGDPAKDGYTFSGWVPSLPEKMPAEDLEVTAQWVPITYQVVFNGNGNTGGSMTPQNFTFDVAQELTTSTFTKTGYSFKGWSTVEGGAKVYDNTQSVSNLANTQGATVNLYAVWGAEEFTITFDSNGGSDVASLSFECDAAVTAPADPEKEGYTFAGWSPALPATMPANDLNVTAQWTVNQYTISFANTGDSEIADIEDDYGATVVAPADPTKTGYTFAGWDMEIPATMPAEDLEITAQWTINQYTITFDSDGGSDVEPITQDYNSPIPALTEPTKTGHTFAGWSPALPAAMPAENVTHTALWTVNQYTISFENTGDSVIADIEDDYGAAVSAPADPTKTGYTFAGWDMEIPATMPAEDLEITAQWTINQYNITFDSDGGSDVAPIALDYNTPITAPAAPEKEGYTFAGWYPALPAAMPAENVTHTAQWTVNQYTITFDSNGGSEVAPITKDYGASVEAPAAPSKTGYTFDGWSESVPATMPAENKLLVASWAPISYTVSFDANGGTGEMADMAFTYDAAQVLTANAFTKDGWYFNVWNTAPDGSGASYSAGTPVKNLTTEDDGVVTLYAQWTKGEFDVAFDANCDDVADPEAKKVMLGTLVPEPEISRTGYTLAGWYTESGDKWDFANDPMGAGGMTLKAVWALNQYTLTFADGFGGTILSGAVDYGAAIAAPADPEREGYEFTGWDPAIPATMPAEDVTVTAQWDAVETDKPEDPKPEDPKPDDPKPDDPKPNDPKPEYPSSGGGGDYVGPPLSDLDGDGIPDVLDSDKDNDGIPNAEDPEPLVPNVVDTGKPDGGSADVSFEDVDRSAWYHDSVRYAVEHGIMEGVSRTLFSPNSKTTRAQAMIILWRLEQEPSVQHALYFSDVSAGAWYLDALHWASSKNIVEGYSETLFGGEDFVTREQLAAMMWRYARQKGVDVSKGISLFTFSDAKAVSEYAVAALQWACGEGLIQGTVDKHGAIVLDPQGSATRAQIATILMRFCENIL